MNLSDKWIKKAKQRTGIKGEHAYLEALQDVISEIDKHIEKLDKDCTKHRALTDFKLKVFNTNKKK